MSEATTTEAPSLARLQQMFEENVVPKLASEKGLTNPLSQPRIVKAVVNVGVGRLLENQKLKQDHAEVITETLTVISGQKPIMIKAKKSVSNFKVREGAPSAFMVTMRRYRMWSFLDRLMNLAMPRIKDFRGVSPKSFDSSGSYSFGLTEQAVFPEVDMTKSSFIHGMHINIVFARSNPELSHYVLSELGFPFVKPESSKK